MLIVICESSILHYHPTPGKANTTFPDTRSGANSPVLSRNVSPRASPAPVRKANDPFSEFVIDTKTSQVRGSINNSDSELLVDSFRQ